jgi:hypothetical protein
MKFKRLLDDKYQILKTFNPNLLKQLKLVSKISLWIGLITLISLTLLILILMPTLTNQYTAFTQLILQIQNNLPMMLSLCGLVLIIGASFSTWFICLYSSFRISGPLYCFSKNIKLQIKNSPYAPVKLRKNDSLQEEAQLYNKSMSKWQQLYQDIKAHNENILSLSKQTSLDSTNGLHTLANQLSILINKIKL